MSELTIPEQLKKIKSNLESISILELDDNIKRLSGCIDTLVIIGEILFDLIILQDYVNKSLKEHNN